MKPYVRWIILAAGLVAAVGLFILVRPVDEADRSSPPSASSSEEPSPSASAEAPSPDAEQSPPAEPTAAATVIHATVQGGNVDGPSQPEVQQGERVRIVVEADVSDEVHLHGYDLTAEVAPDEAGEIEFRATATGVFEVELEDGGLVLFQLRVVP